MRTSEPPDACLELGAESPRRLFTSLAPLRETPTGGLLFPAGEEIFSVDLGAEGDRRPRFDFPGHDGPLEPQAVGAAPAAFFAWERCKQMAASGPLFFCC